MVRRTKGNQNSFEDLNHYILSEKLILFQAQMVLKTGVRGRLLF